jgi:hypothetical protein
VTTLENIPDAEDHVSAARATHEHIRRPHMALLQRVRQGYDDLAIQALLVVALSLLPSVGASRRGLTGRGPLAGVAAIAVAEAGRRPARGERGSSGPWRRGGWRSGPSARVAPGGHPAGAGAAGTVGRWSAGGNATAGSAPATRAVRRAGA